MPRCKLCQTSFKIKYFNQKHCMENEDCIKKELEEKFKMKCKADRKEFKEKNKKLSDYRNEARKVFQQWIRKRDEHQPCISCGCKTSKQWDAGHYLKSELFTGLIFNENNCHKQCSVCNDFKSGNELEYRDGLITRYGLCYVLELEKTKNEHRNYKFTKQELIELKEKYKQKLKH